MRNKIRLWLEKIFSIPRNLFAAILLGLLESLTCYLLFFQRHFFSYTYLVIALILWLLFSVLNLIIFQKIIGGTFRKLSNSSKYVAVIASVIFSLIILSNTPTHPLYYLLPDSSVDISIPFNDTSLSDKEISLIYLNSGQGFVHFSNLVIEGDWYRENYQINLIADRDLKIHWEGKVGPSLEIVFGQTDFDQKIIVKLNGNEHIFNLNDKTQPTINIRLENKIGIFQNLLYGIPFVITVGFLLFTILLIICRYSPNENTQSPNRSSAWYLYALPMAAAWIFSLLVFWPGVLSNDSFDLWGQAVSGSFNDWQSAFYGITLSLLLKIIYSPAFVLILQIVLFSIVIAWGLKTFSNYGVPNIFLWVMSFLFALSPINHMMVITLWKDVPYALAFLLLTIFFLKIFFTEGKWVSKNRNWIALGIAAFFISILRQNGIPVVIFALAILPLFYKKYFKQLLGSFFIMAALFFLMKGPVYSAFNVDRGRSGQENMILLHHIGAHLSAGSEFSEDELKYLDNFLPLEKWDYSCCYMGNIFFESGFKQGEFLSNTRTNFGIFIRQFITDPLIDVKHMLCSGEIAWKYNDTQCYMKSTHGLYSWRIDQQGWIGENNFGLEQSSIFPKLLNLYGTTFRYFGFLDDNLIFYLRPAFYLYLAFFAIIAYFLKSSNPKIFIVGIPVLFQSALLFAINFAPVFRYFYSTFLVGLFLLGLFFLPMKK